MKNPPCQKAWRVRKLNLSSLAVFYVEQVALNRHVLPVFRPLFYAGFGRGCQGKSGEDRGEVRTSGVCRLEACATKQKQVPPLRGPSR
jgi:hypothetical protein